SRFDAIDYRWKHGSVVDYLARLDEAFHETLGWCQEHDELVTMFSGGVDSTLLLTYMNGRRTALFHAPESVHSGTPDPTIYATRAARLLNLDLEIRRLKDGDNWVNIESNIDKAALPQRVVQTVMYTQAYAGPGAGFIHGSRGDALFGAAGTRNAVLSARVRAYPLDILLRGAAQISGRANGLLQSSRQLMRDPESPLGWAAGMSSRGFTDFDIVSDAVGTRTLQSRLARRVRYASTRLGRAWKSSGRLYRHLELAHWIDYWCEDSTTFLRQLALAHRKRVHLPFLSTPLVATAMSVPAHQRYHRNFAVKYLLKEALRRRLPSYPVDQKKGITSMRLPPTYRGRNRDAVWEEYGMPDFIPKRHHDNVRSFNNAISHNALTYSMFDKRILRNSDLAGIAGTRVLEHRNNRWYRGFIRKASEFMGWIVSTAPLQMLMSAA
ncbi:MAG TPA: asparagine synthase-related protein, partial [Alphaproteobacteria bacterium]|nr:asparagine synthase-related protein [Alphaproteobacteria bacterium]